MISRVSSIIFNLTEKYALEPNTVCLYEKVFRKF
jgi:hypothetical protein